MTSAQVVETSVNVTTNSPSQDYTHPDDHNLPTYGMFLYSLTIICVVLLPHIKTYRQQLNFDLFGNEVGVLV